MNAIPLENEIYYPESDGEPMAESELHLEEFVYVWQALKERFENEPEVFVGANLFLYYQKGNPRTVVAPDGFVVKGVPKLLPGNRRRRKYLLWEEGQAPCFVLETTSDSTRSQDVKSKRSVYEELGVDEYFLFDPLGDYLSPRLQGFRLMEGRYRQIRPKSDGSLVSNTTGVVFHPDGPQLRLADAVTGATLLRKEEEAKARRQAEEARHRAEEKAAIEARARHQAEEKAAVEAKARRQAEEKAAAQAEALQQAGERVKALEEELACLRRSTPG
ncbi:MAG TPA: Uma2 family endonuclease [Thermoanaerobaculia bacterium]|nr:Uma2 family endonuclease [Thermoanaerobaculia bacterium]